MSEVTIIERGQDAADRWMDMILKATKVWIASNDVRPTFYRITSVCPSAGDEKETCDQCGHSRPAVVTEITLQEVE